MRREQHVQRPRGTVGRCVRELQDVQQQGENGSEERGGQAGGPGPRGLASMH